MPIYEFYCADCHAIYNFLSRTIDTSRRPDCPRCGRNELERRASAFAISKGRKEEEPSGAPDLDDARLEQAMATLAGEAEGIDESDPKAAARLMRRLYETAGLGLGPNLEEAMRRLEAGEDPEAIEEELGDVLEAEDPFGTGAPASVAAVRRRVLPPRTDPELYEL